MRARVMMVVLLAASVAGCASSAEPRQSKEHTVVDTDKIAQVDRAAWEAGIAVHWVNPPTKRVR